MVGTLVTRGGGDFGELTAGTEGSGFEVAVGSDGAALAAGFSGTGGSGGVTEGVTTTGRSVGAPEGTPSGPATLTGVPTPG